MTIPDNLRNLAREDLINAIYASNEYIIKTYQLEEIHLKDAIDIEALVSNTEKSIALQSMNDDAYIESIATLLVFLYDDALRRDFVLFRFLMNHDLDNLYANADIAELLLSDMVYSQGDKYSKTQVIHTILSQIRSRIDAIRNNYKIGNKADLIAPLQYIIPRDLNREMKRYRLSQIDRILEKIVVDDGDESSIASMLSEDFKLENKSKSHSPSSSVGSSSSSNASNSSYVENIIGKLLYSFPTVSSKPTVIEKEEPGVEELPVEEEEIEQQEELPIEEQPLTTNKQLSFEDLLTRITPAPLSKSSVKTLLSRPASDLSFLKSKKCKMCEKPFTHSYKTPWGEDILYFCSASCMESWTP